MHRNYNILSFNFSIIFTNLATVNIKRFIVAKINVLVEAVNGIYTKIENLCTYNYHKLKFM